MLNPYPPGGGGVLPELEGLRPMFHFFRGFKPLCPGPWLEAKENDPNDLASGNNTLGICSGGSYAYRPLPYLRKAE